MPSQYGNTRIKGKAKVHLGDEIVTNHIHFDPNVFELLMRFIFNGNTDDGGARNNRKYARREAGYHRHQASTNRNGQHSRRKREKNRENPRSPIQIQFCGNDAVLPDKYSSINEPYVLQESSNEQSDDALASAEVRSTQQQTLFFMLLERLHWTLRAFQNETHPSQESNINSKDFSYLDETCITESDELSSLWSMQPTPGQQLLLLCIAFALCLLSRSSTRADVASKLSKMHQDKLLPYMMVILAFGFTRYFYLSNVPYCLSNGDYILLEDAYGALKQVSIAVCEDWSILKAFLEVHYRNKNSSAGYALIKADSFNLLLGSRRGRVIQSTHLSLGLIKSGSRIVNAVFVDTEEIKCLTCPTTMQVTGMGEFHCIACGVFHRDIDTLKPMTIIEKRSASFLAELEERLRHSKTQKRPGMQEKELRSLRDMSLDSSLPGLKYIDLRITPRTRLSSEWLSDKGCDVNGIVMNPVSVVVDSGTTKSCITEKLALNTGWPIPESGEVRALAMNPEPCASPSGCDKVILGKHTLRVRIYETGPLLEYEVLVVPDKQIQLLEMIVGPCIQSS